MSGWGQIWVKWRECGLPCPSHGMGPEQGRLQGSDKEVVAGGLGMTPELKVPLTSVTFPRVLCVPRAGFGAAPGFENEHEVGMKGAPSRSGATNTQQVGGGGGGTPTGVKGN